MDLLKAEPALAFWPELGPRDLLPPPPLLDCFVCFASVFLMLLFFALIAFSLKSIFFFSRSSKSSTASDF